MPNTTLTIRNESFAINDKLTYTEIASCPPEAHGLLMNARFIQGIFDDRADCGRFARFGQGEFDPSANTARLIAALPEWYAHGLRAFTVGFQGGGACFTIENATIDNNPFGADGKRLDPAYAERMDRLIRAADDLGMAVIVSYLYGTQAKRLTDGRAIRNAVITASRFLKEGGYTNVMIEVANEQDNEAFRPHPLVQTPEGMASLLDLSRAESGGMPVGCSGNGASAYHEIAEASDVILIHGNGCTRQQYYNLIRKVKSWQLDKPIVCNEDSQAIGQMEVAWKTGTSWGYYNNLTKQEPPTDWRITPGEDAFFARRMAMGLGIPLPALSESESYYLHGCEPHLTYAGNRWLRVASLKPESIDFVDFYLDGRLVFTAYDEPFSLNFRANWHQGPWLVAADDREWRAEIHLRSGAVVEKIATLP